MNSTKMKDVLVVDDDAGIRSLMSIALKRVGLQCETAKDGLDAMEQLGEAEYAVVLLDLMMPRLDGRSVLERLHASLGTNAVLPMVIVMTAFPSQDALVEKTELVRAVVQKPFDVHELAEIVRGCVATRRAHSEPAGAGA